MPEGFRVARISPLVGPDGVERQWMRLEPEQQQTTLTREALIEMFEEYRGKSELTRPCGPGNGDLLTLYPTADVHLGMRAWARETGEPYDLAIAKETLLSAMRNLITCAPASETAVMLDLGDYLHTNDQTNVTPAHRNQLDVDGRFPKIAKEAVKIRRELIELALQKHDKVIYRGLPGNHDPEAQQMISIALSMFFENNPKVTIDSDPSDFWFYHHGSVMLAGNHGHKLKPFELPGVMASYRPAVWGATKWRHAFSGHIHQERSGEKHGARWETLRTVAAKDAYAHQRGYSSDRELTAITYSATRGPCMRQYVLV